MDSYDKNPWESVRLESPTEQISDPQEIFNNIKLDDFPFLRSHLSFIDYLVRCKICDVILLPESLSSHYETRHSNTDSKSKNDTALLPYQAISHYHQLLDKVGKKTRLPTKRERLPAKRSRRSKLTSVRHVASMDCISETDSLSSCTDDPSKLVSSNASEEESDRLREPVLLKLAKADGYSRQFECKPTPPKIQDETESARHDRSVWSVVYNKKLVEVNAPKPTPAEPVVDNTVVLPTNIGFIGRNSFRTESTKFASETSLHSSPSLSPHLPSPVASSFSDEINSLGTVEANRTHRSTSRSSNYSSSSSGFEVQPEKPVLPKTSSKFPAPTNLHVPTCFNPVSSSGVEISHPIIRNAVASIDKRDTEARPDVRSTLTLNQQVTSNLISSAAHALGGHRVQNGYHTYMNDVQFIKNINENKSKSSKPLRTGGLRRNHSTAAVLGYPNQIKSDAPFTFNSMGQSKRSTIHCIEPNGTPWGPTSASGRLSVAPSIIHDPSVSPMSTALEDSTIDSDNVFDPLTQCGCIGPDGMFCRNSLLCLVHKMEQKRRIPRPKDLRTILRELRGRLPPTRQKTNETPQTSLNLVHHPNNELLSSLIDLTGESNSTIQSSTESASAGESVIHISGNRSDLTGHVQTQENSAKDPYVFCSNEHSLMNETTLIHPHYSSRLSNRLLHNDANLSISSGMRGSLLDRQYTKTCPNITIGNSGDPFVALRHPTNLRSNQVGAVQSTQFQNKFMSLSARYPSGVTPVLTNRKVARSSSSSSSANKRSRPSQSNVQRWSSAFGTMCGPIPANLNPSALIGTNQPMQNELIPQSSNPIPGSSHVITDVDGSYANMTYSDMHDSMLDSSMFSQSSYGTMGMSTLPSDYPHSVYGGNRMPREPQSRVVVEDMREKSITGRSKKSFKSVYRQSAPVFPNAHFGSVLPPRYRQNVVQPASAYLASGSKPTVGLVPVRPVSCRSLAGCSTTADMFAAYDPRLACGESAGTMYHPSFITPSQSQPMQFTPIHSARSQLGSPLVSSLSPFSHSSAMHNSLDSDTISLDNCIETTLYPSNLSSDPLLSAVSESSMIGSSDSHPSTSFIPPQLPRWIPSTTSTVDHCVPASRKNRYFVIRPNALTRTPSFVLRARQSETCLFPDNTPTNPQDSPPGPTEPS